MSGQAEPVSGGASPEKFRRVNACDAWNLILDVGEESPNSLVVLDMRDASAFAKSHLYGALHLTDSNISELLARTHKAATVLVYCYHGNASQDVASIFGAFGFSRVFSIDGGFEALEREHGLRKSAEEEESEQALPTPERRYIVGDCVYAREAIENDGGMPGVESGARVAAPGARGIVVQVGHPEADPQQTVYAVRFETAAGELGPVVGCLPEELSQEVPPR